MEYFYFHSFEEKWACDILEAVSAEHFGDKDYTPHRAFASENINVCSYCSNILVVFHFVRDSNNYVYVSSYPEFSFRYLDIAASNTIKELIIKAIDSAKEKSTKVQDPLGHNNLEAVLTRLSNLIS